MPLAIVDVVTNVVQAYASHDFLVGYRFSPEEPETGGITMKETLELINELVEKPLDYLHVSLMDLQSIVREGADQEKKRIDVIQQRVNHRKPIIGIGSIYTAEDAVNADQTRVSLIGLGRELLMDSNFIVKLREGREEDIVDHIDLERTDRHGIPKPLWDMILQADWFPIKGKNEKGTTFLA